MRIFARLITFVATAALLTPLPGIGQNFDGQPHPPGEHFSRNMTVLSHVPLGAPWTVSDVDVEQEPHRPFAYVSRMQLHGFDIIDFEEPTQAKVIYRWRIENAGLHEGMGSMDPAYFKLDGRYYFAQSFQFRAGGPNNDLGAVIFDVTSLPDTTGIREVGRIRVPEFPGGFHNIFFYVHSDGNLYLFATVESPVESDEGVRIYDMRRFLNGDADQGLVGYIPLPEPRGAPRGYHDAYVAYDPVTGQDKFYGGGPETSYEGGNFVWDISDVRNPQLLVSIRAIASQQSGGHTFVATPDHRHVMTVMTSLGHQPVRFYDLKPALDGQVSVINEPVGAWNPDPRKSVHMLEVRWPYMFVAGYTSGLQVVYMRDPANPFTYAFYDTYPMPEPYTGAGTARGAFGVDVRNSDGLIVVSDMYSGFWLMRMDGFNGWHGHDWGVPNASTVQDWDNGPDLTGPLEGPGIEPLPWSPRFIDRPR